RRAREETFHGGLVVGTREHTATPQDNREWAAPRQRRFRSGPPGAGRPVPRRTRAARRKTFFAFFVDGRRRPGENTFHWILIFRRCTRKAAHRTGRGALAAGLSGCGRPRGVRRDESLSGIRPLAQQLGASLAFMAERAMVLTGPALTTRLAASSESGRSSLFPPRSQAGLPAQAAAGPGAGRRRPPLRRPPAREANGGRGKRLT